MTFRRAVALLGRSIVVGGFAGVVAGALLFLVFGFIGLVGGDFATRISNGWDAAVQIGLRRGLFVGAGVAAALACVLVAWSAVCGEPDPRRTRPWLTGAAALIVIAANLPAVRRYQSWNLVTTATIAFVALLTSAAVWLVAPWILRSLDRGSTRARIGSDRAG